MGSQLQLLHSRTGVQSPVAITQTLQALESLSMTCASVIWWRDFFALWLVGGEEKSSLKTPVTEGSASHKFGRKHHD